MGWLMDKNTHLNKAVKMRIEDYKFSDDDIEEVKVVGRCVEIETREEMPVVSLSKKDVKQLAIHFGLIHHAPDVGKMVS